MAAQGSGTRGALPLTSCLQGKEYYGELQSLKPEHVEPYLAKNMYYKVVGVNGEIDPSTIPNFHVAVKCTKVIPAESEYDLPDLYPIPSSDEQIRAFFVSFVRINNPTEALPDL